MTYRSAPHNVARDRVLCGRWLAGEPPADLADDYGVAVEDVFAILRAGLTHKRRKSTPRKP